MQTYAFFDLLYQKAIKFVVFVAFCQFVTKDGKKLSNVNALT